MNYLISHVSNFLIGRFRCIYLKAIRSYFIDLKTIFYSKDENSWALALPTCNAKLFNFVMVIFFFFYYFDTLSHAALVGMSNCQAYLIIPYGLAIILVFLSSS